MQSAAAIPEVRGSIVVSISACHAEDPGSIPGRGVHCNSSGAKPSQLLAQPLAMRSPRVVCEAMPKTCKQEGRMRKKPAHPPSGARSGPQTRQRARAPIALAHMEESSHTGRRRNREERAAPGIEPGTSRTLSENHATRPSSQLLKYHGRGDKTQRPLTKSTRAPDKLARYLISQAAAHGARVTRDSWRK